MGVARNTAPFPQRLSPGCFSLFGQESSKRRPPHRQRASHVGSLTISRCRPPLRLARCPSRCGASGDPEAGSLDDSVRRASATDRSSNTPGGIGPASATEHPILAVPRGVEIVPAPLPHIAQCVEQPETVRLLQLRALHAVDRVEPGPRDIAQISIVRTSGSCVAGVLPFGFRRKSETIRRHIPFDVASVDEVGPRTARVIRQAVAESDGIEPRDAGGGPVSSGKDDRGGGHRELDQRHVPGGTGARVAETDPSSRHPHHVELDIHDPYGTGVADPQADCVGYEENAAGFNTF